MRTFRLVCSKVHLYVGLVLSLVLILISLTGSALVFRGELDRLLRPDLLQVEATGAPRIGPERAVETVRTTFPKATPRLVDLPQRPTAPYTVRLQDERHVFVDAYRGTVLGMRSRHDGVMGTLFALHAELLAGSTGRWIVGISGLLTLLLAVTGLVLWWPAATLRWRRLRAGLVIAWQRGGKRLNYDLHRAGGFYTLLFLVLVAATGSALIFYEETGDLLTWTTGSESVPPPPTVAATPKGPAITLDAALQSAQDTTLPDAAATFVYLPVEPTAPMTIRLRAAGEWHPNGRSFVYLDPHSGEVLRTDDARQAPLGTRILHALYPLHIGDVGNVVVRWLYVILGLAPTVLSITGAIIWYTRWRKQHAATANGQARDELPARPVAAELPRADRTRARAES